MSGVDVLIQPTSLDPIRVEMRESWALSAPEGCYHVRAVHFNQAGDSVTVALGSVPDCVAVPEPGIGLALALGALWLAASAILGPVLGRMLKRNGERYRAPAFHGEREKPPEP